jgi:hypothetical protein
VYVHRGIRGVGQIKADDRDWRNPLAMVRIRLVR